VELLLIFGYVVSVIINDHCHLAGNFSLHYSVPTDSGAHPASYEMGTRVPFLGQTTHLILMPRSRMRGAIHPLPQCVFMAWCLVKHRDNFTFMAYNHLGVCSSCKGTHCSCEYP